MPASKRRDEERLSMIEECVMVIPRSVMVDVLGDFQGFMPIHHTQKVLDLLHSNHLKYCPRSEMEKDPAYKQLIPYCVFRCEDSVFVYQRGSGQGESRLHGKWSMGIGGHVSSDDGDLGAASYDAGLQRELSEEVDILRSDPFFQKCVGFINDDSNEVGEVHLGVVHVFSLLHPLLFAREPSIRCGKFVRVCDLNRDDFESWSQICIDVIKEGLFDG